MKIAAVICEYNPFHNGHKYLVDKIKNEHADCVVAIMSGSFVQRGDIAITDKYQRAKAAIEGGCDLVVELPTIFALSSAERFAKGAVSIAKALNADTLCFGAEDDDNTVLQETADAFSNESFNKKLKEYINEGLYYPKAVHNAIEDTLGSDYAQILNKPNNTLAIEYIKALRNSNISPVAIKRTGVDHDSSITCDNIASATHIRELVLKNKEYKLFTDMTIDNPANIDNLETAILYKLRSMSKKELQNLPDVDEGLHNRIYECCRNSNSLSQFYENLKTKRYTLARLRRITMCALLSLTKDVQDTDATYLRILGMNDIGAKVISCAKLPVIGKVKKDYDNLSDDAKAVFDIDVKASEIFALALNQKSDIQNDFTAQIIKI